MDRRNAPRAMLLFCFLLTVPWRAAGFDPPAGKPEQACKLAVVIVIDQLRPDFLTRFGDLFADDGFKLLMERGAWFRQCRFEHGVTKTGPGHACVSTGANPSVHGIVGNDWMEEVGGVMRRVNCVADAGTQTVRGTVAGGSPGSSPRKLKAATLAESLKAADPAARVLSCSLKNRSACLSAGPQADGVFWWDIASGCMVSSSFYAKRLPDWVAHFNDSRFVDRYLGATWDRLLPVALYDDRCRRDSAEYEARGGGDRFFPHRLDSDPSSCYRQLRYSTFGNNLLFEFVRRGLEAMKLGRRGATDLLFLSLSSNDDIGHEYGPFSHEVMDVTLRTDRQLAQFFKHLDDTVGLRHCVIALTSDHGAGMAPEYAVEQQLTGGHFDARAFAGKLEEQLQRELGPPRGTGAYVAGVHLPWLYFNPPALRDAPPETLRQILKKLVRDEPGLAAAFWGADIQRRDFVPPEGDVLRARVKAAYYPSRSGQVYLTMSANWYAGPKTAGHGTAHDYDTDVPLLLFGPGIKPGRYDAASSPTDLAPTLARLLRIAPPAQATGRVLREALRD